MMSIHETVRGRRAEAPRALAANLVGGHLVVPTYLIAADARVRQARSKDHQESRDREGSGPFRRRGASIAIMCWCRRTHLTGLECPYGAGGFIFPWQPAVTPAFW